MKVSPSQIKRAPAEFFTVQVTSKAQGPEFVLELRLKKVGGLEWALIYDRAKEWTERYVDGKGEPGKEGYEPPLLLPPIGGQPVFVSASTCQVATALEMAQAPLSPEDRYDFEDFISFMVDDEILSRFTKLFGEIDRNHEEQGDPNNPLAGKTDTSGSLPTVPVETQ